MPLTEQEKQEVIRYLEADKPLPDKYRFLLFEDKREVELVWNGKTGEVCNIVLPFQVIEPSVASLDRSRIAGRHRFNPFQGFDLLRPALMVSLGSHKPSFNPFQGV